MPYRVSVAVVLRRPLFVAPCASSSSHRTRSARPSFSVVFGRVPRAASTRAPLVIVLRLARHPAHPSLVSSLDIHSPSRSAQHRSRRTRSARLLANRFVFGHLPRAAGPRARFCASRHRRAARPPPDLLPFVGVVLVVSFTTSPSRPRRRIVMSPRGSSRHVRSWPFCASLAWRRRETPGGAPVVSRLCIASRGPPE